MGWRLREIGRRGKKKKKKRLRAPSEVGEKTGELTIRKSSNEKYTKED